MNRENNQIDDLFKDAFENWEEIPHDSLWENIDSEINGAPIDLMFKDALEDKEIIPDDKVWSGVKDQLPLNLWLKRHLSKLSYVAGILVICMVVSLIVKEDNTEIIVEPKKEVAPIYNIEVAMEEVKEVETVILKEKPVAAVKKKKNKGHATDNTIEDKMRSVELNTEDDVVLDIDPEKMREILRPIQPLPIDSSVAKVNGSNNHTTSTTSDEDESIIPENIENILPPISDDND